MNIKDFMGLIKKHNLNDDTELEIVVNRDSEDIESTPIVGTYKSNRNNYIAFITTSMMLEEDNKDTVTYN